MFTLRTNLLSILTLLACSFASPLLSASESNLSIAQVDDAKVFANFTDELPAVVNYFTKLTEEEIISFYQSHYGQEIESEMKRGRLSLRFAVNGKTLTVIISAQGKFREVDLMLKE